MGGWCGHIRDVGNAHDRNFLVIESPKLLSRASDAYEVLETKPSTMKMASKPERFRKTFQVYFQRSDHELTLARNNENGFQT